MSMQSVGDQARSFALQLASNRLKLTVATLTQEIASGEVADLGHRLQGNGGVLTGIEARIAAITQFQRNATDAGIFSDGVQNLLEGIRRDTANIGVELASDPFGSDGFGPDGRATEVATVFETVIQRLNSSAGGRFVMGGLATDSPPVSPAAEITDHLMVATSGLATATAIALAVSDWFDAPVGGGGYLDHAYSGTLGTPLRIPVAEGTTVAISTSAASPEIRDMLKGLAMAAVLDRGALPGDPEQKRQLMILAGQSLYAADRGLIGEMGRVGLTQKFIEQASTSNSTALSLLSVTRNDMRSADPFETAAALTEVQNQLEALYAVTARLSKLKLVDFLR
ncbi:MAG: hypothetical protein ACK4YU_03980 [Paracoccus sp. (in: a-proteobacteria)]